MKAQMHNFSAWVSLCDPEQLDNLCTELLQRCGFNVLSKCEKHFSPHGYTALYLLSESHFAIHTFPEHNSTYIELSSCVLPPFVKFTAQWQSLLPNERPTEVTKE